MRRKLDNFRIDKTKSISPENRRLDTLAKLLTGDSVCTAITLFCNDDRKELLISTNELKNHDSSELNAYFKGDKSRPESLDSKSSKLGQTLKLLSDCAAGTKNLDEAKSLLFPYVYSYLIKDKFFSSGNKVFGSNASGLSGFISIANTCKVFDDIKPFIVSTNYTSCCSLIDNKDSILNKIFVSCTDTVSHNQKYKNKCSIKEFFDHLSKVKSDINKICQILYTDQFSDIKSAIQNKNFILVGPHRDEHYKSCHAEMNLISYLLKNEYTGNYYLGITKLTCFDCSNDIIMVNNIPDNLTIQTRGEHNVKYSDRRVYPDFDDLNKGYSDFYRFRLNQLPNSEKGNIVEYHDFSGSEADDLQLIGEVQ